MKNKDEYTRATAKNIDDIRRKITILKEAFDFFETQLCDRKRYYFYQQNNKIKCLTLNVKREHFMHLCGFEYANGGAKRFWHDLKRNHLVFGNLYVKKDGSTFQKLQVINLLPELNKLDVKVTAAGTYLNLQYEHAIRTRRELMMVAFKYDVNGYIPLSLLKLGNVKFKSAKLYGVKAIVDYHNEELDLVAGDQTADFWVSKSVPE